MRKLAIVAATVAALAFAPVAAAQHVQSAELTTSGSEFTVTGKVVGLGNHEGQLQVEANVSVVCANGVSFNMGTTAAVFGPKGSYDFTLSSYGMGALMGCDQIVSATLNSVEVR